MFNSKQKQLFEIGSKQKTSGFISEGMKTSAVTVSGNDAKKYSETEDEFVNQFGTIGSYKKPRSYQEISNDMIALWDISFILTLKFILYIRMITRVTYLWTGKATESIQKGAGLKHEGILRMMWLQINYPKIFWKNIHLFISVGSWKDIIQMLSYDLQYNGWKNRALDWDSFGKLILAGLENPNSNQLLLKYLPQIKANSNCKTLEAQADNMISKWICYLLFKQKENPSSYKQYRLLKAKGTAHVWQQLISKRQHSLIDFNTIPGRALSLLVSSKYLKNQGLEKKYEEWLSKKPVAKFTGYVYELASNLRKAHSKYQIDTIDKQYQTLLEKGGNINSNFIVVKDTSGSMDSTAIGTNVSSYHVAKSLSIFFGNLLKGWFHNHYIDFSSKAILRQIKGRTFSEQWNSEIRMQSANTNFLAVAQLFVEIGQKIREEEFPSGLLIISDYEFDSTGMFQTTNIEAFKQILIRGGFSREYVQNLKFVFWDIRNGFYHNYKPKFETYTMDKNVFYFSGFDGSVISFLTGEEQKVQREPKTAKDVFENAMNQEVLNLVEV